ncbi:MAG: glycosyltransferase family 1 protein [Candidatus Moranbacteria bacterium]|nr:glycosyltransferase family 1 protein [Candidatus Moranbacteria bacterium]
MTIGINVSFLRKPGTGIGQVTHNVLRTLISNTQYPIPNEHEFFVYCEEEPILDFKLPENFHIRTFLPFWKRDDVLRKWLWEKQLAKEAVKDGCDVFLNLYQSATSFEKYKLQTTSYKLPRHVMVVHDVIPELFPEYLRKFSQRMHWRAVRKAIRKADAIVAISESTKHDLMRLGIREEKITVAYPDVAPQFRQPTSEENVSQILKKYSLERGYIYHGGGLEVRKNAERLLRAYASMTKSPSTALRAEIPILVISGKVFDKSNKLATDVEGLIKELYLEEKVKLLGFVPDEDLPALYKGALFFVYPSLYEGFGLPVLQALCQSVPVLTAGNSSLPEVGGEAALYVDSNDTEAIATQMEHLLIDETLRTNLVSHSNAQAEKFHWEHFVQKILATLKQ